MNVTRWQRITIWVVICFFVASTFAMVLSTSSAPVAEAGGDAQEDTPTTWKDNKGVVHEIHSEYDKYRSPAQYRDWNEEIWQTMPAYQYQVALSVMDDIRLATEKNYSKTKIQEELDKTRDQKVQNYVESIVGYFKVNPDSTLGELIDSRVEAYQRVQDRKQAAAAEASGDNDLERAKNAAGITSEDGIAGD